MTLQINSANPTVSTASAEFVSAADGAGGWEGQAWDTTIVVPATTLDALIAEHGAPGLRQDRRRRLRGGRARRPVAPLPALSFEFTTIQRDVALACLDRLASLGAYGFDVALGESQQLTFGRWLGQADMAAHLSALPHEANSGDVYCVLQS